MEYIIKKQNENVIKTDKLDNEYLEELIKDEIVEMDDNIITLTDKAQPYDLWCLLGWHDYRYGICIKCGSKL